MRPCQAAPAFETTISTPPKCAATAVESRAHGGCIGHVAGNRQRVGPIASACSRRRGKVDVEQRDLGARRGERLRGRGADGAGRAGDGGDLAGERRLLARAELGLFQRPIFAVEHVGFGDRLEAADAVRVADDRDPVLGDVGGDHRVTLGAAKAEQAEPGTSTTRGRGSSSRLLPPKRSLWRAKYA